MKKYNKSFRLTKNKKKKIKNFFLFLLFFSLLGGLIYFVFFSGFFLLEDIVILKNEKVKKKDILVFAKEEAEDKKFYYFDHNLVLINSSSIKEEVKDSFPTISEVEIKKEYPSLLKIIVKEREAVIQINLDDTYFLIDKEGVVFEDKKQLNESLVLINKKNFENDFNLGDQILNENLVSKILDFNLKVKNLDLDIKKFNLISEERINILTEEGWQIYLDPQKDINWQFTKLETVLKGYLSSDERKNLEYIELRFGNTAPIKKRD